MNVQTMTRSECDVNEYENNFVPELDSYSYLYTLKEL